MSYIMLKRLGDLGYSR